MQTLPGLLKYGLQYGHKSSTEKGTEVGVMTPDPGTRDKLFTQGMMTPLYACGIGRQKPGVHCHQLGPGYDGYGLEACLCP